ncbi:MAG: SUF system NifU family Fe-S cluster assembly protein [Microbacteriaceae bacterium]|jgi:nitrogen fixation NifU-like protein|nr:SUF system NifU family Fe-S cluster assembly protein [Microbacteriaceae bacterium]MCI1207649.1 SUF system NifU family Fe-S cluster assembly protein [Microbacteriaceae bacterium]
MSNALEDLYQTIILEQAKARTGEGIEEHSDGSSHQVNPTCGDEITVQVDLDGDRVSALRWEGDGCTISMASASILSELAVGWDIDTARDRITTFRTVMRSRGAAELPEEEFEDGIALNGVSRFIMRVKCAMMSWVAFEDALAQALATGASHATGTTSAGVSHC